MLVALPEICREETDRSVRVAADLLQHKAWGLQNYENRGHYLSLVDKVLLQSSLSVHPDAIEKTIDAIMDLKKINPDVNPQLSVSLQACLLQIVGYRNLIAEVEKLRREPYDSEDSGHEEMLLKLWKCLKPDSPLEARISKQWCEIGFQGDDPKTDFRGMGLLGLYNLLYFAEQDAAAAQQVLLDSLQPKYREVTKEDLSKCSKAEWEKKKFDKAIGYSFAIVGINITDLAYNLLLSGALKTHFYNVAPEAPTLTHFQQTFCVAWVSSMSLWIVVFLKKRIILISYLLEKKWRCFNNSETCFSPGFQMPESECDAIELSGDLPEFHLTQPGGLLMMSQQHHVGYLMHEFHKFWIDEDPLDIMEFNRVREKFHKRILKQLQNPEMALCPHFAASESLINL
uniref:ELMO domain-containing protein 1 n=1 Tax=Sphaerodactylus townsendi TaxID=933632 RepID=A0ACB8FH42_9SAUR